MKEQLLESLRKSLPPIITRQEIERQTGKLINSRTLANWDALKIGPDGKMMFRNKVAYEREAFLRWFAKHLKEQTNV